jgi:hypothetical protein
MPSPCQQLKTVTITWLVAKLGSSNKFQMAMPTQVTSQQLKMVTITWLVAQQGSSNTLEDDEASAQVNN